VAPEGARRYVRGVTVMSLPVEGSRRHWERVSEEEEVRTPKEELGGRRGG